MQAALAVTPLTKIGVGIVVDKVSLRYGAHEGYSYIGEGHIEAENPQIHRLHLLPPLATPPNTPVRATTASLDIQRPVSISEAWFQ